MPRLAPLALALALLAPAALAQSWTNLGGGPLRNGLKTEVGPKTADVLWSNTDDFSLITWAPHVWVGADAFGQGQHRLVVTVRESSFPGAAAGDAIVAYDLDSGAEAWSTTLPYGGDPAVEWIAWIGGVEDGVVWAARSDNSKERPLYRLDVATGAVLGQTDQGTNAFAYDGIVFAPDGDAIVGDRDSLIRFDRDTGATVWDLDRTCAVSGNCGGAATDTAVFVDQVAPGGQVVSKVDLATGAVLYESPVMPGFTAQNQPFLSPDGSVVYFARSQNNPPVDSLYAFADDGAQLTESWNRPVRWTTGHEHGVGADGTVYTFLPGDEFVRLDPATGDVVATAGALSPVGASLSPKTAVDRNGTVYVSNGWANTPATDGRVWAFDRDLNSLFTLPLDRPNQGGPALADDGTLVVADRQGVHAWRSTEAVAFFQFVNGSGLNPEWFETFDAPALGTTWHSTVQVSVPTGATFVGVAGGSPVALCLGGEFCELLLDPAQLVKTQFALGAHAFPIPADPSLSGVLATAQGGRVDFVGPTTTITLANGYALALGL